MSAPFHGSWITTAEFASLAPYNVFHRQLDKSSPANPHQDIQNRHILYRRKFTLNQTPKHTYINITADDYYKLYVNGQFVAQGPAPAYTFRYYYNTVDLTPYIVKGENTIAVHTFYQGLINRVWVSGDNRHGLIYDVFADDQLVACSDAATRLHPHTAYSACGTVGYSTQFMERYDANAPECDFFRPAFDDSQWPAATCCSADAYTFQKQPSKQLVFETIRPVDVKNNGTSFIFDFGAIYVGYLTLIAKGTPNAEITLRFAQELNPDGTLRHKLRCNCVYEEKMILSGRADYLNEFDYKSFRYAEIILPPDTVIDPNRVTLIARHYPFHLEAKPKYTDDKALAVWNLCVDTLHWGVQEVIQDCMDREKGYYMGDGCYTLFTYCLLQNDFSLMEKFIDDCLDTAFVNRGLMTCADCAFMQEIAEYPLIMLTIILPYLKITGHTQFIADRYDKLADIMDFYREQYAEADGLLNNLDKWCVVEWPQNCRDGYDAEIAEGRVCTDKHNAINAYYVGAVKVMNQLAALVGRPPYADEKPLVDAFLKAFYVPEKHLFKDSVRSSHISIPGNVFAAFYGLYPDEESKQAIIALIREKRLNYALLFIPFPMFCFLLRENQEELVHSLLTDDTTWLRIIAEGGTRTFEGWGKDIKWNTSLFHLTLSLGAAFLTDWPVRESLNF